MSIVTWLLSGVSRELAVINLKLDRTEVKMDQERVALDALTAALTTHFTAVDAGIAEILRLVNLPTDPDVDNSAEIAAIAGQIQASTDAIKAVLPTP